MPSVKFYSVLSDVANVFAGTSLMVSFFLIMLQYTFQIELGQTGANWIQYTMSAEGAGWFVGGFALAKLFIKIEQPLNAVSQTLIAFGGLFFFVSGWNSPIYVISLKYIIPVGTNAMAANEWLIKNGSPPLLDVAAACPFYGITCFMVATAAGLISVLPLPKTNLISPFWGITFFFLGAWTIGVCALWAPAILGGFKDYTDYAIAGCDPVVEPACWLGILDAPIGSKWTHPFQLLGAIFLTTGAVIFAIMNNRPQPAEAQQKLVGSTNEQVQETA